MANRLPVPPELLHLIEKRDTDQEEPDDRRSDAERRDSNSAPPEPLSLTEERQPVEGVALALP